LTTYGDWAAITGNGTADSESAASNISVSAGAVITRITVTSLTVGNTYAVKISAPSMPAPQKYVIPVNGCVLANGGKIQPSQHIDVRIPVPSGASTIQVSIYADVASATAKVALQWEAA